VTIFLPVRCLPWIFFVRLQRSSKCVFFWKACFHNVPGQCVRTCGSEPFFPWPQAFAVSVCIAGEMYGARLCDVLLSLLEHHTTPLFFSCLVTLRDFRESDPIFPFEFVV
jgi:hypothetical protein